MLVSGHSSHTCRPKFWFNLIHLQCPTSFLEFCYVVVTMYFVSKLSFEGMTMRVSSTFFKIPLAYQA
jgi:hypothetical protein